MGQQVEDFTPWAEHAARRLLRAAVALCGDHHAAEDLVQDVLARVYLAWGRVDDPDAYARRALVNASASRWRSRARRPEVPLDERLPLVDTGRGTVAVDDRLAVITALQRLPARQRAVVVLRHLGGATEAETARAMGTSVGTVKSQTSKALARLRTLLEDDDVQITGDGAGAPVGDRVTDGRVG